VTERQLKPVMHLRGPGSTPLSALPGLLSVLGFAVRLDRQTSVRDVYLATDDWWLYRARASCRIRQVRSDSILIVEPLARSDQVGLDADELQEQLDEPPGTFPAPIPGIRLSSWLGPMMDCAPVDVRLELQGDETLYHASLPDGLGLEVTAARLRPVSAFAGEGFSELRLRAAGEPDERVDSLAERVASELAMVRSDAAALCRGLELAGITPPVLVEGDDLTLRRQDRFVDAAYRVLRRHFRRMLWNEPGTRLGLDPECLHDMRVAGRRMRAALRLFGEALPPRRLVALRRDLRWVCAALGRVRDIDVYLADLKREQPHLSPELAGGVELYRRYLRAERQKARRNMIRVLDTARYRTFVDRFRRFLEAGPPTRPAMPTARPPAVEIAGKILSKRLSKVLRGGRALDQQSPDADLHAERIRCKRLRYACEFFADLYGREAVKLAERVTRLQDALGKHQDEVVARRMLAAFAAKVKMPRKDARRLYMALGELRALHAERAKRARTRFFKLWKRFDRKKTKKPLKAELNKLRLPGK